MESDIFSYLDLARFLSDDEIKRTKDLIIKLSKIIQTGFAHHSISPKLHILLVHIYPLLLRWRTLGLFNEQALENVHQVMKHDSIFFRSLEINPEKHDVQVFKHQYVRSIVRGMDKAKLEEGDIVTVIVLESPKVVSVSKVPATVKSNKIAQTEAIDTAMESITTIEDTITFDDSVINIDKF